MTMLLQQQQQPPPDQPLPPPFNSLPPPSMAGDLSENQLSTMMPKRKVQQYKADLKNAGFDADQSLWIGGLRPWMDEKYFTNFCDNVYEAVSVQLFPKSQNQEPKYGFIQFRSTRAAEFFLWSFIGKLMPNSTKTFNLKWATFVCGLNQPADVENGHYYHENFQGYGNEEPYRTLLNIIFVRVNKIKALESDSADVYGTVSIGHRGRPLCKVYDRSHDSCETICPGDGFGLTLTGPVDNVNGDEEFSIHVNLKVGEYEIANGTIHWSTFERGNDDLDTFFEEDVGNATVGYSVVTNAYIAAVELVLKIGDDDGESLGVYGSVEVLQNNGASKTRIVLFDKFESEKVAVRPNHAIPLTRSIMVMPRLGLSIEFMLFDAKGCKIVDGDVYFRAVWGQQIARIDGKVELYVRCN